MQPIRARKSLLPRMSHEKGFSLVELMVAITIGLLLLTGLSTVFVMSSRSYGELRKASGQIENGRYAMDIITQDLHHAGFYGQFTALPAVPGSLPDPCVIPTAGVVGGEVNFHVQGTHASSLTATPSLPGTSCAAYLTASNLKAGSDILVVRRLSTNKVVPDSGSSPSTGNAVANEIYMQATPAYAEFEFGVNASLDRAKRADNTAATGSLLMKDPRPCPAPSGSSYTCGTPPSLPQIAADIRKYVVHVYFVAPCNVPNGGGTSCTGAADDGGNPIPTLKRLELTSNGTSTVWNIVPLVEGIEFLRVEYGLDNLPTLGAGATSLTGLPGDGIPEGGYIASPGLTDWPNIVAARVFVLARNLERTTGYSDPKTYCLGTQPISGSPPILGACPASYGPTNDSFKRHLFDGTVRLVNPSSRREIPS